MVALEAEREREAIVKKKYKLPKVSKKTTDSMLLKMKG